MNTNDKFRKEEGEKRVPVCRSHEDKGTYWQNLSFEGWKFLLKLIKLINDRTPLIQMKTKALLLNETVNAVGARRLNICTQMYNVTYQYKLLFEITTFYSTTVCRVSL